MSVVGINVNVADSFEKAVRFRKKFNTKYPLVFENGDEIARAFKVPGTPWIILVSTSGEVLYRGTEIPENLTTVLKLEE